MAIGDRRYISIGALSPTLMTQLDDMGLEYTKATIEQLNKDAEACTRLKIRLMVTDKQAHRIYSKILKQVWKNVALNAT